MSEELLEKYKKYEDYQIIEIISNEKDYTKEAYDIAYNIYKKRGLDIAANRDKALQVKNEIKKDIQRNKKDFSFGCLSLVVLFLAIALSVYVVSITLFRDSYINVSYRIGVFVGSAFGVFLFSRFIKYISFVILKERRVIGVILSFIITVIFIFFFYGLSESLSTIFIQYIPFAILFSVLDYFKESTDNFRIWKF